MAGARRSEDSAPAGDLPDEIYIAFVDGLVFDSLPMLLTASAVMAGEIAAAVAARQPILLWTAASQLVIAAARIYFSKRHARILPSSTVEIARRQERNFSRGALASLSAARSSSIPLGLLTC